MLIPLAVFAGRSVSSLCKTEIETAAEAEQAPASEEVDDLLYEHYESAFDYVDTSCEAYGPEAELSRNAWVDCGGDIWALKLANLGYIRIKLAGEQAVHACFHQPLTEVAHSRRYQPNWASPQLIGSGHDLRSLIRTADGFVRAHKKLQHAEVNRHARWRYDGASRDQRVRLLRHLLPAREVNAGRTTVSGFAIGREQSVLDVMDPTLTAGQVDDILTRLEVARLP